MTQRQHFIEAHETIIPVHYLPGTRAAFCHESPCFNRAMNALEALEQIDDDTVIQVLRMNTRTWQTENVTEEMAKVWLDDRESRFSEFSVKDEDTFPAFVKQSAAWALRKDDLEAEAPVKVTADYAWKERREQQMPQVYNAMEVRV